MVYNHDNYNEVNEPEGVLENLDQFDCLRLEGYSKKFPSEEIFNPNFI